MMDIEVEKIRRRAYEFWMADGMAEGACERHWLSAEQAVRNETEMPAEPASVGTTAKIVKAKAVKAEGGKTAKPSTKKTTKAAAPRRAKAATGGAAEASA